MKPDKRPDVNNLIKQKAKDNIEVLAPVSVRNIGMKDYVPLVEIVPIDKLAKGADPEMSIPLYSLAFRQLGGESIGEMAVAVGVSQPVLLQIMEAEIYKDILSVLGEEVKTAALTYLKGMAISAVGVFAEAMENGTISQKIAAAKEVLDRIGVDKVYKTAVTASNAPDDPVAGMTDEQKLDIIKKGFKGLFNDDGE